MRRILLVDDEVNVLKALQRVITAAFRSEPLAIETFERPADALARAEEVPFDVVVSDYRMPGMDGVAFLKAMRALQPQAVRLVLSAQADQSALIGAINEAQILRFLAKPWSEDELIACLRQALETHDQRAEDQALAERARVEAGRLSRQEYERRQLERQEPGITKVKWGPNGEVLLDED